MIYIICLHVHFPRNFTIRLLVMPNVRFLLQVSSLLILFHGNFWIENPTNPQNKNISKVFHCHFINCRTFKKNTQLEGMLFSHEDFSNFPRGSFSRW